VAITDLFGDEVVEKINRWRLEEQVVWNYVMEETRIAVSQTAGSDQ
jgi:hypothetical protein